LSTEAGVVLWQTLIKIVKLLADAEALAQSIVSSASGVAAPVAGRLSWPSIWQRRAFFVLSDSASTSPFSLCA